MPNDTARNFARCGRGLVIGPAGCGKTYLIAEAVGHSAGRQLVLTHTHAGVAALRSKLAALGVPTSKYRVTTIDSLCLCYANAFPHLAGWTCPYPNGEEEWKALRVAACRVFECRAPRRVLRVSYDGVFVDEYQDCCGSQHAIVGTIAQALPCRVVGDPLQAIYRKLHADDVTPWSQVEGLFPVLGVLSVPHRWLHRNAGLGDWLKDVRIRLERGQQVDFGNAYGLVKWIPWVTTQNQMGACYKAFDQDGVVAICDWTARCVAVAENTRNHFAVLESVECPDLLTAADKIESSTAVNRVAGAVEFALDCMTGMAPLVAMFERIKQGRPYRPRSPDKARLWTAMLEVIDSNDMKAVLDLLLAIEGITGKHFYRRREMWREMRRALQGYDAASGRTLRDTAWATRDHARKNGRRIVSKRTVATPLLIKGLEFNHALLLDAAQMKTAEELYVALTRGSFSLTVLSAERMLRRAVPAWLAEAAATAYGDRQVSRGSGA